MSQVSDETTQKESKTASKSDEDKFVPRNAYEEVSKDMHKYKSQAKEAAAKAAELESRMKAIEEAKLVEEKRYEELYAKEREEREKMEQALKSTNEHYVKTVKMTALMRELGNIKPKYLQHAAIDEIVVHDDGSLSSESVVAVANKFRQENPELVPAANVGNINDAAPSNDQTKSKPAIDFDSLSKDDLRQLLSKAPRGAKKSFV